MEQGGENCLGETVARRKTRVQGPPTASCGSSRGVLDKCLEHAEGYMLPLLIQHSFQRKFCDKIEQLKGERAKANVIQRQEREARAAYLKMVGGAPGPQVSRTERERSKTQALSQLAKKKSFKKKRGSLRSGRGSGRQGEAHNTRDYDPMLISWFGSRGDRNPTVPVQNPSWTWAFISTQGEWIAQWMTGRF